MSAAELAEFTGLLRSKVNGAINKARADHDRRHFCICEYRRGFGRKGSMVPVYKLGPGRDVKKPDASTPEEQRARHARYRERHRAEILAKEQAKRGSRLIGNPFAQLYTATGTTIVATRHRSQA